MRTMKGTPVETPQMADSDDGFMGEVQDVPDTGATDFGSVDPNLYGYDPFEQTDDSADTDSYSDGEEDDGADEPVAPAQWDKQPTNQDNVDLQAMTPEQRVQWVKDNPEVAARGFLRAGDYTRKTQALAEAQRKLQEGKPVEPREESIRTTPTASQPPSVTANIETEPLLWMNQVEEARGTPVTQQEYSISLAEAVWDRKNAPILKRTKANEDAANLARLEAESKEIGEDIPVLADPEKFNLEELSNAAWEYMKATNTVYTPGGLKKAVWAVAGDRILAAMTGIKVETKAAREQRKRSTPSVPPSSPGRTKMPQTSNIQEIKERQRKALRQRERR